MWEFDELSEKQRTAMTSLCALMVDEQEGPIRKEPELLMQVMEWSQDAAHPFYRHGARVGRRGRRGDPRNRSESNAEGDGVAGRTSTEATGGEDCARSGHDKAEAGRHDVHREMGLADLRLPRG